VLKRETSDISTVPREQDNGRIIGRLEKSCITNDTPLDSTRTKSVI
jgi:hypothetical protein